MKAWIASLSILTFSAASWSAEKPLVWPQFRGPSGSGIAEEQKPPVKFGPDQNVKWKVAVPSGFSSPIVAGDKIVLTAFDSGKLYTIAYNQTDGKEAWRTEAPAKQIELYHKAEGSPAASTPVTDGERIVSYFGSCGLFCYDLAGKELWNFTLPTATIMGDFGTGVSPIIAEGLVILVRDEMKDAKIIAIEAATGSLKWEKKRQSKFAYATPAIWDTPAGKQVVVAGLGRMIGYDLKTGDDQWFLPGMPAGPCASPVTADGKLFFAGWSPGDPEDKDFTMPKFDDLLKQAGEEKLGYITKAGSEKTMLKGFFDNQDDNKDGKLTREEWDGKIKLLAGSKNSAFALKAGGKGDISQSHLLWKKTKGMPYVATGIVYRGQYVMVKDGGLVTAFDTKTGAEVYLQERAVASGRYYASPVAANGHLYFTSLDDGVVTVVKAGSELPVVVAKNPKLGERVAATPAIAHDTIYVRTEKHLYAFAEKN